MHNAFISKMQMLLHKLVNCSFSGNKIHLLFCVVLLPSPVSWQRELRSADVKILQQLEALNEGMECMRWLWEERTSQSSLTTNQSSQNTIFFPNNQLTSDSDEENWQKSLTSGVDSQLSLDLQKVPALDKATINESQRLLLGHRERLGKDTQTNEVQNGLQNMQNDPDPHLHDGELLLGYDVQWRWVEREDDVVFLWWISACTVSQC